MLPVRHHGQLGGILATTRGGRADPAINSPYASTALLLDAAILLVRFLFVALTCGPVPVLHRRAPRRCRRRPLPLNALSVFLHLMHMMLLPECPPSAWMVGGRRWWIAAFLSLHCFTFMGNVHQQYVIPGNFTILHPTLNPIVTFFYLSV